MPVNVDHVHIFFQYPPKYSLSYIAKKIKGRLSKILRQEFPHLRDWREGHLWYSGCYHESVGQGWGVSKKGTVKSTFATTPCQNSFVVRK